MTPERLADLAAQRDWHDAEQRAAAARRAQRLADARRYGAWLASERLTWGQITTVAASATLGLQRPHDLGVEWACRSYPFLLEMIPNDYDLELVDSLIQGIAEVWRQVEASATMPACVPPPLPHC